jgi:peptide/nickel transport system permease protein
VSPTDRRDDAAADAADLDERSEGEGLAEAFGDAPGAAFDYGSDPDSEAEAPSAISGHSRDGRVATDGGSPASEFDRMAEASMTSSERRRQWLEERVLAPARIVWDDWRARTGLAIVTFYVLVATVGTRLVAEPSPNQGGYLQGAFLTLDHPLGTTASGVDILSQTVHSTPPMLVMLASGAVFTVSLGTVVGTLAGYKGGAVDTVLMFLSDTMLAIPGLPLTIVLAAALDISGNPVVIGILVVINAWAGLARAIRSQVLTLRDAEYVEASRLMGMSTTSIVSSDIVPNLMPYISMNFVQQARAVIFGSVGLYFLGVLPYSGDNWGVMMNAAVDRAGATSSPAAFHWLLAPMLAVIVLALGLTLLAQGADRVFNPRVRARHVDESAAPGGDVANTDSQGF